MDEIFHKAWTCGIITGRFTEEQRMLYSCCEPVFLFMALVSYQIRKIDFLKKQSYN